MERFFQHKKRRRMRVICPPEKNMDFMNSPTSNLPTEEFCRCCDDESIESFSLELNRCFFSNPDAVPAGIKQCQVR